MKLFMTIMIYGTIFFACLIPLALAWDLWECWQMRKTEAGNKEDSTHKSSVAHDIKHNDLLQRIMDAKPEAPEELYKDLEPEVKKDKD